MHRASLSFLFMSILFNNLSADFYLMKELIFRLTDVSFTLSSVNRATITATGEASTPNWTGPELANPRIGDGILHLDFVAQRPEGAVTEVITPIETRYVRQLGGEPQDVTVHSATNEMSVRLPAAGDPP